MKGSDEQRTARFQTVAPLYPLNVSTQVSGFRSHSGEFRMVQNCVGQRTPREEDLSRSYDFHGRALC